MSLETQEEKNPFLNLGIIENLLKQFFNDKEIDDKLRSIGRTRGSISSGNSVARRTGGSRALSRSLQVRKDKVTTFENRIKVLQAEQQELNEALPQAFGFFENPYLKRLVEQFELFKTKPVIRGRRSADIRAKERQDILTEINRLEKLAREFREKRVKEEKAKEAIDKQNALIEKQIQTQPQDNNFRNLLLIGGALAIL